MNRLNYLMVLLGMMSLVLLTQSCATEEEVDPCESVICENGGICVDGICDCPDGFLGTNCENFDPSQVQILLDGGKTPQELFNGNVPLDSLYGKMYEGGIIFYLNTNYGTGMVAATEDQSESADWGCMGTDVDGAEGIGLSSGSQNTMEILAVCTADGIAADLCDKYSVLVDDIQYNDWSLPSKNALDLMWTNLADSDGNGENTGPDDPGNLGGFAARWYWSSTETDIYYVWLQRFVDGNQYTSDKLSTLNVRAVRAF